MSANKYFLTQEEAELGSLVESLATTIRAECPPDKTVKEFLGGEGSFLAKKLDLAIANDVKYQHLAQRQFVDRDPIVLGQAINVTKGSKKRKWDDVDEAK